MTTPIEQIAALRVGTVESVAPDKITIALDPEAPQSVALNSGAPTMFPRVNSYLLVPRETGALVGLVVWVGIERAGLPKGPRGENRFVDLPVPARRLLLSPVGSLVATELGLHLERGVVSFPTVGDAALIPTREQLRAIVEPHGRDARVPIGEPVLASGASVSVDPDRLFGRHVAVLGNTGSGKSCTVAGLIRWSLDAAEKSRQDANKDGPANARFIVLDPNGEYATAFQDMEHVRLYRVPPVEAPFSPFTLPAWMWNSEEWSAFASASPRVQRPILVRALRDLRSQASVDDPLGAKARTTIKGYRDGFAVLQSQVASGSQPPRVRIEIGGAFRTCAEDATHLAELLVGRPEVAAIEDVAQRATEIADNRQSTPPYFNQFAVVDFDRITEVLDAALDVLPEVAGLGQASEDAPIRFNSASLASHLELLARDEGGGQAAAFIATLILRIRTLLADPRMGQVSGSDGPELADWLESHVGADGASNGAVSIIDLSLVPSDVVHLTIAVLARLVFESVQRYRRMNGKPLPTVLVLEEAHTFVGREWRTDADSPTALSMCRGTFERIAREGRKFGLGLMLSSQRPSELSQTVLAQCNSFVLHRLVNDRDQDLVGRLVPDNLAGLLAELPTLPTRHAVLLGWATPLPVLMKVRELAESERPRSSDPDFWDTWTGVEDRPVDWTPIVSDWTQRAEQVDENGAGGAPE